MNRSLHFSFCVFFGIAIAAHAEVVSVTATRTAYDATLDRVILRVQSIDGLEVPEHGWGVALFGMLGWWDFGNGAVNLRGTANYWAPYLLNDQNFQDTDVLYPRQSWVNFAFRTSDAPLRISASGTLYHAFRVGFYGGPNAYGGFIIGPVDHTPGDNGSGYDGYGFDNTLLAVLYVSHATTLTPGQTIFSGVGSYGVDINGDGIYPTTVQIVPEPSSLVLVTIGLVTATACLFRRRHVLRG